MTKLFVAAGACSFGAHVVVEEFNLAVDIIHVKLRDESSLIFQVNPLGRVPSLLVEDDALITENVAVLSWLGDLSKNYEAFAAPHTVVRTQIQSWLAFFASEVHAGAFRLVNRAKTWSQDPIAQEEIARIGRKQLQAALAHIDQALVGKRYLVAERFTIADAYLGVFLNWALRHPDTLNDYAQLRHYVERYNARDSVKAVHEREAQWQADIARASAVV